MVLDLFKSVSLRGLVIALFLMPSLSFADVWQYSTSYASHFSTVQATCDYEYTRLMQTSSAQYIDSYTVEIGSIGGLWSSPNKYTTTHKCKFWQPSGALQSTKSVWAWLESSCPSGEEDDGSGNCIESLQCDGLDSQFWEATDVRLLQSYVIIDGCYYVSTGVLHVRPDFQQDTGVGDIPTIATYEMKPQSTAPTNLTEVPTSNLTNVASAPTEASSFTIPRSSSASTEVSTPQSVTDPDGTVTTSESVTIQQTSESSGLKIWENADYIFVQDETGTTTITQKNVTTISNPDGSATIQESTAKTTTTAKTETESIPKDASLPLTTNVSGGTVIDQGTSNITNNYNSQGQLTSSESTGDGQGGDAESTDENGDTVYTGNTTQKGNFNEATAIKTTELAEVRAELTQKIEEIKLEATELFTFNHQGSGSLPCPAPVPLGDFGEMDLCLDDYAEELSVWSTTFLLMATILAVIIILR